MQMNARDEFWDQPVRKAQELLNTTDNKSKAECRSYILDANYRLLFRIQNYKSLWEQLLLYPDVFFRRQLYANWFGLSQQMIRKGTGIASGTVHNLLKTSHQPPLSVIHTYAVMCNVPWQTLVEQKPDEKSFYLPSEYWFNGASVEKRIEELNAERDQVRGIRGYWINDPLPLFEGEKSPITVRWVNSYPEMEYFEFHLNHEPALYPQKRNLIQKMFPFATHLVTTYTPLRPYKRSFWILGPKSNKQTAFAELLKVIEARDLTSVFPLN
ncbi:hypothetical protein BSK66_12530 [Paenibacillus odorifer]|uniref:Uncharacterized protein n=2 Tax=Paenibacillus TaxID=44249 RepID=A0A1R0XAK0_9BACL|nr:hypothetical protein BJP51_16885 [Paenibacillus odorifer]OME58419.1 hypothetical protein BSK66_12530 [Paenibacillus odorifer]